VKKERSDQVDKVMDAANEAALQLLVDSGIFDPLLTLSNVRDFHFKFHEGYSDIPYKPLKKHTESAKLLKQAIEANFKEKDH